MHSILRIHANEADRVDPGEPERDAMMRRHEALERDLRASGKYRGCGGLHPEVPTP